MPSFSQRYIYSHQGLGKVKMAGSREPVWAVLLLLIAFWATKRTSQQCGPEVVGLFAVA